MRLEVSITNRFSKR